MCLRCRLRRVCALQMNGRALTVRLDSGPQEALGESTAKRAAADMSAYGGMAGRSSERVLVVVDWLLKEGGADTLHAWPCFLLVCVLGTAPAALHACQFRHAQYCACLLVG